MWQRINVSIFVPTISRSRPIKDIARVVDTRARDITATPDNTNAWSNGGYGNDHTIDSNTHNAGTDITTTKTHVTTTTLIGRPYHYNQTISHSLNNMATH